MAGRIRTVKPEWLEDDIALESSDARVASIGLILLADDHGRGRANETILGAAIFPGTPANIREALARLSRLGFLALYMVGTQRYFRIINWGRHQRVDRPSGPRVPCPCGEFHTIRECPAKDREVLAKDRGGLATDPDPDPDPDPDRLCRVSENSTTSPVSKKPKRSRAKYSEDELRVVTLILGKLADWTDVKYRPTTEAYRRIIVARMRDDGATEHDLRSVVYHKGHQWANDEKMVEYLRPETLFQKSRWPGYLAAAEKFERNEGIDHGPDETPGSTRRRGCDDSSVPGMWQRYGDAYGANGAETED